MNLRVKERARRRRRSRLPRQSLPRLGILKILSKRNNKDHKDFVFERIRRWFLYWNIYRLWNNHFTRLSLLRSKCPNPSFLTILPVLVINVNHVKDVKRSPQKSDGGYEWCRTCLPCACVGNFPISLVSLAMLSEIYHGLGKVSVNNRLNFAILFIITISLRPAQNTVTQPCWKRVSPARGWRRVYTGLLAFGPPWKIEIVFSQVFGLLLMVTVVTVTITINLFDFEMKFRNTVSQIFRWRRNVRLSAMTALLVDSSFFFSLKPGLEIFTTYVC